MQAGLMLAEYFVRYYFTGTDKSFVFLFSHFAHRLCYENLNLTPNLLYLIYIIAIICVREITFSRARTGCLLVLVNYLAIISYRCI